MANKTNVTIDRENLTLTLNRTFNAPRSLVFKAFSEAERLKHWWGPREWPLTHCEIDFRVGGVWHYCMTGPDGSQSWGKAVYDEIEEPERIVYTDAFSDAEGNINEAMPVMKITNVFTEANGATTITSTSLFADAEQFESIIAMGVVEGASETWDLLEEYLATLV